MAFQVDKKTDDKDPIKSDDKDSPDKQKQASKALAELKKLVERGASEQDCAKFISQHLNEVDKLMAFLHSAKGNAFVGEVTKHLSPRPNAGGGGAGSNLDEMPDDGTVDQIDPNGGGDDGTVDTTDERALRKKKPKKESPAAKVDDGTVEDDDGTVDSAPAGKSVSTLGHEDDGTVEDDDGTVDSRPRPKPTGIGSAAHGTRKPR